MTSHPEARKKGTTIKNHSRAVSRQREVAVLMLPMLPSTCSWEERAAHARSRVAGQAAAREPATRAGERPRRGPGSACRESHMAPGRAHATCAGLLSNETGPWLLLPPGAKRCSWPSAGCRRLGHPREQGFWIRNALPHPGQNPELPQHVQQMEQKRLVMEATFTLERTRRPCLRTKASSQEAQPRATALPSELSRLSQGSPGPRPRGLCRAVRGWGILFPTLQGYPSGSPWLQACRPPSCTLTTQFPLTPLGPWIKFKCISSNPDKPDH